MWISQVRILLVGFPDPFERASGLGNLTSILRLLTHKDRFEFLKLQREDCLVFVGDPAVHAHHLGVDNNTVTHILAFF